MTPSRIFASVATLVLSVACGRQPEAFPPVVNEQASVETPLVGTACTKNSDCSQGESCQGGPGCGLTWRCAKAIPCTRDILEYCGCDGKTTFGSTTCPQFPYLHVGPCNTPSCQFNCRDYGYAKDQCVQGWFCDGNCIIHNDCVAASTPVPCQFKCSEYGYAANQCNQGWFCDGNCVRYTGCH